MDEKPEPAATPAIRDAMREFVEIVTDSSKQLVNATERFAAEALQTMNAVKAETEQSASQSASMARMAQQAADDARNAAAGLHAAVEEARQQVRDEARLSSEQVAAQTAQINEVSAQAKSDLQTRIDEMVARIEAGTAGHRAALESAQAATTAAQAAAERIQDSVSAVEAAAANAQRAAQEAQSAADQSGQTADSVATAVASAQEAADTSRQAAAFAELAGKRSDFAAETSTLLERLETDYSLLTRLVQELHTRISSLSSVSVAQNAPVAPLYALAVHGTDTAEVEDAPETADTLGPEEEAAAEAYAPPAMPPHIPGVFEAVSPSGWSGQSAADPEAETEPSDPGPVDDSLAQPEVAQPTPNFTLVPDAEEPVVSYETPSELVQAAAEAGSLEVAPALAPEPVQPVAPSLSIFGRVQLTISPVPDFDRLLSLDSALARVSGVKSVTLADYAREEVIFRVEVERPVPVAEFARQLSETANVPTQVTEASESSLSIRIN